MDRYERIEQILQENLEPEFYEITDDSRQHEGHNGVHNRKETHFTVLVVSAKFADVPLVKRHRMIYQLLDPLIKEGVHALKIKAYDELEWQKMK